MLFDEEELELLERLKEGGEIPKDKRPVAYRLASMGIVHLGFDDEEEPFCETGHLSDLGKQMLRAERVQRSPILRMLHGLLAPF